MPDPSVTAVRVRAPAKINLALHVGGPRPDGFHDLVTVFQAVDLYDEVIARPARTLSLTVRGETRGVPTDSGNLAWRAAELLAERYDRTPDVRLSIRKVIPVAGGMAGGSADAAATLLACAHLWELGVDRDELMPLAAELGSDVPFALLGGTALGTGRGDVLSSVLTTGTYHWAVAVTDAGISARDCYRKLDAIREHYGRAVPDPDPAQVAGLLDVLRAGDPAELGPQLHNDLQEAALEILPRLEFTLQLGDRADAPWGFVSGSGPTCVFLADDEEHAETLARVLRESPHCTAAFAVRSPATAARAQSWP